MNLPTQEPVPLVSPKSISAKQAALLQLAPAVASLPVFAVLAAVLTAKNIPNIFALTLTVLFVEVPVSWAIIVHHVRRENGGKFSFASAFPWTASVPWWLYLLIGLPTIAFSVVMMGVVSPMIGDVILSRAFAWAPDWFVLEFGPSLFASLSHGMVLFLWGLMFVAMILVGGTTQELYARGFLLPRMEHLGIWAPAYNALLFAIFHLVAPWSWISILIMTIPWAYLVWWRRSIKIGVFIHSGMLLLQWLGLTMIVFGVVAVPS